MLEDTNSFDGAQITVGNLYSIIIMNLWLFVYVLPMLRTVKKLVLGVPSTSVTKLFWSFLNGLEK